MNPTTGNTMPDGCKSPLAVCGLDNLHCEICNDTGYIIRKDENGVIWSRDCECMKKRISLRNIADSGLSDLIQRYTFENYQTPTPKHESIKKLAIVFSTNDAECFVITGKSGAGKTHICTAICKRMIENNWQVRYMLWRKDAADLKAMVNSGEAYQREINRLRNVRVLYIDDFFKGTVSEADVNLAFTILNERYNRHGLKTIISTELSMPELVKIDEAIAGRIAERAKGFLIQAPNENWRLKK